MDLTSALDSFVDRFLLPLDDAGSRLFHINLLLALLLVVAWGLWNGRDLKKLVLNKRYWWNRSTKVDYQIYLINGVFKALLLIPFLDFSFQISRWTALGLFNVYGDYLDLPATTLALIVFTLAAFIWDDFLRFLQHVLMHKWFWRWHKVHHSAKILTPITLFRAHPMESVIATLRNSLSLGAMTGMFIFIFGARFHVLTLFGVNAFGFMFNFLGANLRHSHIPVSFGKWVELVLISPKQHQLHHSQQTSHHNKNFGVSLALWDLLLGTLLLSKDNTTAVRFGVPGTRAGNLRSLLRL
jgi:sterol desaturase/sphingolipid hydroxylase (fatty acid hydroxylase superfamily)